MVKPISKGIECACGRLLFKIYPGGRLQIKHYGCKHVSNFSLRDLQKWSEDLPYLLEGPSGEPRLVKVETVSVPIMEFRDEDGKQHLHFGWNRR